MKLFAFVFALVILCSMSASSQALSFGIGADVTFPLQELQDVVATGYGATGLVKFGLLPLVDLTGGVEYIKFSDKELTGNNPGEGTAEAFGVLVGGRWSFLVSAYIGIEGGTYSFAKTVVGQEVNVTRGTAVPLAGVNLRSFDVCARYVSAGDDSFWGLRGMFWF